MAMMRNFRRRTSSLPRVDEVRRCTVDVNSPIVAASGPILARRVRSRLSRSLALERLISHVESARPTAKRRLDPWSRATTEHRRVDAGFRPALATRTRSRVSTEKSREVWTKALQGPSRADTLAVATKRLHADVSPFSRVRECRLLKAKLASQSSGQSGASFMRAAQRTWRSAARPAMLRLDWNSSVRRQAPGAVVGEAHRTAGS